MDVSPEIDQNTPVNVQPNDGLIRFYPLRNRNLKHWLAIATGILMLILALTSLLYGFFTTWTAVEHHGRALILTSLPLFILIAGLAFLIGLILLISTSLHWNDGVGIYSNGISIQQGKKLHFIPWEAVNRFDTRIKLVKFATSVMEVHSKIILESEDSKRFTIDDRIADMRDLVLQCREQLLPRLYEKFLHAFRQGEVLAFHRKLAINLNTVLINDQPHPWEGLEPVIRNRTLAIRQSSSKEILFKANINQFRNTDILLAFLENPPLR